MAPCPPHPLRMACAAFQPRLLPETTPRRAVADTCGWALGRVLQLRPPAVRRARTVLDRNRRFLGDPGFPSPAQQAGRGELPGAGDGHQAPLRAGCRQEPRSAGGPGGVAERSRPQLPASRTLPGGSGGRDGTGAHRLRRREARPSAFPPCHPIGPRPAPRPPIGCSRRQQSPHRRCPSFLIGRRTRSGAAAGR